MVQKSAQCARHTHRLHSKLASHWQRCVKTKPWPVLCNEFELHSTQITQGKRQWLTGAANAFGASYANAALPVDLAPLHAKIGQLTLENCFLEGALSKAGLLSAKRLN